MRTVILASAFFIASVAPTFAQAGKVTAGFTVGVAIPITPELDDAADQDLAVAGHITVGLVRALAVRGEVGQTKFKPSAELTDFCNAINVDCDQKVNHLSVGLQWGGFGTRGALGMARARVLPYGFIALSSYKATGDLIHEDEERQLGFNTGFGVNIKISENAGLQGDIHFHGIRPDQNVSSEDLPWIYWATPSVGVWVGF